MREIIIRDDAKDACKNKIRRTVCVCVFGEAKEILCNTAGAKNLEKKE